MVANLISRENSENRLTLGYYAKGGKELGNNQEFFLQSKTPHQNPKVKYIHPTGIIKVSLSSAAILQDKLQ